MPDLNPIDVERFVLQTHGCESDGPAAYIREALDLDPRQPPVRQDYQRFFAEFIATDPDDLALWQEWHSGVGTTSDTKGVFSAIRDFFVESDDDEKDAIEPLPVAPSSISKDPQALTPSTVAKPQPVPLPEVRRRVDARMTSQQEGGFIRVQPQWSPTLNQMSIVQPQFLPREFFVNPSTFQQLQAAPQIMFPPGIHSPISDGIPVPQHMVRWVAVDSNPTSVEKYIGQLPSQAIPQMVNPQWVGLTITQGKAVRGHKAPEPSKKHKSMAATGAHSTTHQKRSERHRQSRQDLSRLMEETQSVYD